MYQDYLFYGTDIETQYAFRMVHLSNIINEACKLHALNPSRGVIFGEVLLGSMLLASMFEDEDVINLRIQAGTDFSAAVETTLNTETRGYFEGKTGSSLLTSLDNNPRSEFDYIVRSLRSKGAAGKIYEGVTNLRTTSISDLLNDHLQKSFQLPATMKLECWYNTELNCFQGFGLVYLELPNLNPKVKEQLHTHINAITSLQKMYLENDDPDILCSKVIPDKTRAINSKKPAWNCGCSYEAVDKMIFGLPITDLQVLGSENKPVTITCHYCHKEYTIPIEEIHTFLEAFN